MQVALGSEVVATLVAPGVLPAAPMGARIEEAVTRNIVSYWRVAAYDPVTGVWTVVLDSPLAVGEYQLVWRTGDPEPPEMEVMVPLSVVRAGAIGVLPAGGPYPWQPTVAEVASLAPAYTRGGFDDDRPSAGAEHGTFDETTSPTSTAVEELITRGCDEIAGRVSNPIAEDDYGLAKTTAIWYAKAMIAADKQPAGTDDASGEYRGAIARYLANLDSLIEASKPRGGRLH